MTSLRNRALGKLGKIPFVGDVARQLHGRRFRQVGHAFRGVHATYADAKKALPPERPTGYDNTDAAAFYRERLERVYPADYPVLFWLRERMPLRRVLAVGDHVGVGYYAYSRYISIPPETDWLVFDVPAVCEAGRNLAVDRGASNIRFTSNFADGDGADLLFASGSLQYLEESLVAMLTNFRQLPRYLLLNLLPLTDGTTFYTEQTIGVSFCPYRIESRRELVSGLGALGYGVVDTWKNPEKKCEIAFEPERSVAEYDGLHLELGRSRDH